MKPLPRDGEPEITPEQIARHGFKGDEYARVVSLLGREPSFTELGVFSVMWSEHCSYKSSRVHLKTLPTTGPNVLQGPGENAGVIDIGDGLAVAFKMESHNHPSFIEPYQGAATGVGGILRDVFTMGARPIALLNSLRFGRPDHEKTRHLLHGVVAGIGGYGNCVGVPTVGGEVGFHECYDGNILVNAMCVGLLPADGIFRGVAAGPGNPVLYVGARTGRDGIHGATMASDTFEEGVEKPRPTVQVGDPYTEKKLIEACLELMREDAVVAIQDMGAAGLTSSSVEMAGRGGTGLALHVDRVPAAAEGMSPYEFLLSESQERMLIIAARGKEHVVHEIFSAWDLDVAEIGTVTDDGHWSVYEHGVLRARIPVLALTDEAPQYRRPVAPPAGLAARQVEPDLPPHGDCEHVLGKLLAFPDIAEKRWVIRQYDHMVQLGTLVRPGAADAAVIRVPGSRKALALAIDCNHVYCKADPYWGSAGAVAEAARNVACVGARPQAVTDCLNFGNPERPEIMWEFAESVRGIGDALRALSVPVVSGNVSLYNETGTRSVHPTPTIGIVGLLDDRERALSMGAEQDGLAIVLLGTARPQFGASVYARVVHGLEAGAPPRPRWDEENALIRTLADAAAEELLEAAHDLSDGGLAVALAELCFASGGHAGHVGDGLGADVQIAVPKDAAARELALFGETHGAALVACAPEGVGDLVALAQERGCMARVLGRLGGDRLRIRDAAGEVCVDASLATLRRAWERGLTDAVGIEAPAPRP